MDTLEVMALKGLEDRKHKEEDPNEKTDKTVGSHKEILHSVTKAVAYLHKKKVIHGNINPQSIVICPEELSLTELNPPPKAKLANFEVEG